jgi:DnaJ-class molecular chaperone
MTKPRKPLETCTTCRGVGQVPNPYPEEGYKICPDCGGTGKK